MHPMNGHSSTASSSHSSQQLCRFGYECRRPDCWFSHPDGRQIDGNSAPPPSLASLPAHAVAGAGAGTFHLTQNSSSAAALHSSPTPHWAASGGHEKKQPVICRYGRACHRPDCWFSHPEGRSIDDSASSSTSSSSAYMNGIHRSTSDSKELDEEEAVLNQLEAEKGLSVYDVADECECCGGSPYECSNPQCVAQGICSCLLEAADDHNVSTPSAASNSSLPPWIQRGHSEGDDSWKDEWFPQCRNCSCCEGYVYRCKKQNSACNNQCFCFHHALVSSSADTIAEESKASLPATVDEQK